MTINDPTPPVFGSNKMTITGSGYDTTGVYQYYPTSPDFAIYKTNTTGYCSSIQPYLTNSQIEKIVQTELKRLEKLKKARKTIKKLQKKLEKLQGVELGLENE